MPDRISQVRVPRIFQAAEGPTLAQPEIPNPTVSIVTARYGSLYRLTAVAPRGYLWIDGGVHELVAEGRGRNATEARHGLEGRMAVGLRPCQAVDCDWCREEE